MGIGTTIKELLSQRGISVKELSTKTGISINTLYSITKRDNSSIRVDNVQKIADFFGITTDSLLGWTVEDETFERVAEDFPNAEVKESLRRGSKDKLDILNYMGVSRAYDYINYLTNKTENIEPDKE